MREEVLRHFSGPVLPIASPISYRIPDMHVSADHLLVLFQSRKANKDYSIDWLSLTLNRTSLQPSSIITLIRLLMEFGASSCYRLFGLDAKCQQIILRTYSMPTAKHTSVLVSYIPASHVFLHLVAGGAFLRFTSSISLRSRSWNEIDEAEGSQERRWSRELKGKMRNKEHNQGWQPEG